MSYIKWTKLLIMAILSFIAMYFLMYAMVNKFSDIYLSLDQIYMVLLMTSSMVFIEIVLMNSMYSKNTIVITSLLCVAVFAVSFVFVRNQTAISDKEFLKAMISHHSSAILMCNKAKLNDPEIQGLCKVINVSQSQQIDWMKNKLGNK